MKRPQQFLIDLMSKFRKDIQPSGNYDKMTFEDAKRVDLNIMADIFDSDECCCYLGEITNGTYSCTSFKKKKVSVLRLLHHNYTCHIDNKSVIEYLCKNRGICCNLKHSQVIIKK